MTPSHEDEPMMTWIPEGTRFERRANLVALTFPEENDAIMFLEIMQDMASADRKDGGD